MRRLYYLLSFLFVLSLAQSVQAQYQYAQSPFIAGQVDPSQPGMSSLPPGQYLLTSLSSGQSLYITITPNGQMYTQSPPAVQPSVAPQYPQSKFGVLSGLLQKAYSAYSVYKGQGTSPVFGTPYSQ